MTLAIKTTLEDKKDKLTIKATSHGLSERIPFNKHLPVIENHKLAMEKLAKRFGFHDLQFTHGQLDKHSVVFVSQHFELPKSLNPVLP